MRRIPRRWPPVHPIFKVGVFLTKGAPLTGSEIEVIRNSTLPDSVKRRVLAFDARWADRKGPPQSLN